MKEELQKDVHARNQPVKPYYIQKVKDDDIGRCPINQCWGYNDHLNYNFLIPEMAKRRNEFYQRIFERKQAQELRNE